MKVGAGAASEFEGRTDNTIRNITGAAVNV